MQKRGLKILGTILMIAGTILIINSFTITGLAILEDIGKTAGSILGIILVFGGILLLIAERDKESKLKEIIANEISSGKVGKYKDLERYAAKLGYEIREDKKHTGVYKDGRRITEIPRHAKHEKKGTYRSILSRLYENAA